MKKKILFIVGATVMLTNSALLAQTQPKTIEHYSASVIPKQMTVAEKKKRFFALLVPAVEKVYKELEKEYLSTKELLQKDPHNKKITALMKSYRASTPTQLLRRMKPHPRSLALAQSATESAWATSRFFRIANNIFGVWSFNKNEPRVPASKKRGNKTIYVKKYASIADSIKDYYKILATGRAFKAFRAEKMKTDNPYILVKYLNKYSERGAAYTKGLAALIKHNKLTKYDK
jgi:Bax protein